MPGGYPSPHVSLQHSPQTFSWALLKETCRDPRAWTKTRRLVYILFCPSYSRTSCIYVERLGLLPCLLGFSPVEKLCVIEEAGVQRNTGPGHWPEIPLALQ